MVSKRKDNSSLGWFVMGLALPVVRKHFALLEVIFPFLSLHELDLEVEPLLNKVLGIALDYTELALELNLPFAVRKYFALLELIFPFLSLHELDLEVEPLLNKVLGIALDYAELALELNLLLAVLEDLVKKTMFKKQNTEYKHSQQSEREYKGRKIP